MCGLMGYARNPSGSHQKVLTEVLYALLEQSEHRGKHATGLAIHRRKRDHVTVIKRAVPASTFLGSTVWDMAVEMMHDKRTQVVQGHVRHATHDNAAEDEAAHPFEYESVVGAHNGIITNWDKVADSYNVGGLTVDSQAAILALAKEDLPASALGKLHGYFALTWMKKGTLFLARTNAAPLTAAYLPEMCALVWHSEGNLLEGVLKKRGLEAKWINEIAMETVYQFRPSYFGKRASPQKTAFEHNDPMPTYAFDSKRPGTAASRAWDHNGRLGTNPYDKRSKQWSWSVQDLYDEMEAMYDRIRELELDVEELRSLVYTDTHDPIEIEVEEGENVSQLSLLKEETLPPPRCVECDYGAEKGALHQGVDGDLVHMACVIH